MNLSVEFVQPLFVEVLLISLEDEGGDMNLQDPLTITEGSVKKCMFSCKRIDRVNQFILNECIDALNP